MGTSREVIYETMLGMVRKCNVCPALERPAVPPAGSIDAKVMILGRNPGRVEFKRGAPFVGPGGILLDQELTRIGIDRNKCWVTNVVNCYSHRDRPPTPDELVTCVKRWLFPQLQFVKPVLVIALGRQAAEVFLGTKLRWDEVRGQKHWVVTAWGGFYLVPASHPGHALYAGKQYLYQDFNGVLRVMQEVLPQELIGTGR